MPGRNKIEAQTARLKRNVSFKEKAARLTAATTLFFSTLACNMGIYIDTGAKTPTPEGTSTSTATSTEIQAAAASATGLTEVGPVGPLGTEAVVGQPQYEDPDRPSLLTEDRGNGPEAVVRGDSTTVEQVAVQYANLLENGAHDLEAGVPYSQNLQSTIVGAPYVAQADVRWDKAENAGMGASPAAIDALYRGIYTDTSGLGVNPNVIHMNVPGSTLPITDSVMYLQPATDTEPTLLFANARLDNGSGLYKDSETDLAAVLKFLAGRAGISLSEDELSELTLKLMQRVADKTSDQWHLEDGRPVADESCMVYAKPDSNNTDLLSRKVTELTDQDGFGAENAGEQTEWIRSFAEGNPGWVLVNVNMDEFYTEVANQVRSGQPLDGAFLLNATDEQLRALRTEAQNRGDKVPAAYDQDYNVTNLSVAEFGQDPIALEIQNAIDCGVIALVPTAEASPTEDAPPSPTNPGVRPSATATRANTATATNPAATSTSPRASETATSPTGTSTSPAETDTPTATASRTSTSPASTPTPTRTVPPTFEPNPEEPTATTPPQGTQPVTPAPQITVAPTTQPTNVGVTPAATRTQAPVPPTPAQP